MGQARTIEAILIAGPTASGKSALALELATRLGGVVINADSMQVYRDLSVITARPTDAEERAVPHALYGTVDGATNHSVTRWLDDAKAALARAQGDGSMPILVGGTGLYFKALTQGLSSIPPVPADVRAEIRAWAEGRPPEELHAELGRRDPATAALLRPTDPQRLLRALEVNAATGASLAALHAGREPALLDGARCAAVFLEVDRAALRARIDQRFEAMMAAGALDEVRALAARALDPALPIMRAHGVPALLRHVAGACDLATAVAEGKADTRRYIKRQATFARHQLPAFAWCAPGEAFDHLLRAAGMTAPNARETRDHEHRTVQTATSQRYIGARSKRSDIVNEHSMPRKVEHWQVVEEAKARQHDRFLQRLARKFARRGGKDAAKTTLRPNALPETMLDTARVPGFEGARTWAISFTPAFEEVIIDKNRQVVAAAEAGVAPDGVKAASFLALSGGGDKGAFAAGLLAGWGERGDRPTFEVVTGVSAGALAAPFAFIDRDLCLEEIYTKYGAGQLFKSRGIRGFFSDALNDTSRLEALIRHYVTDLFLDQIAEEHQKGRRLLALTTNIDAQRPVVWALSGIASSDRPDRRDLFVKVLRASSALPGVFPPVKIDVVGPDGRTYNEMHVDGGVTAELVFIPPESRILHLEDMFFKERRRRTLYVVMNGKLGPEYSPIDPKLVPLAQRAVQTLVKYQAVDNLLALALVTKSNGSRFFFNAIPPSFNAKPRGLFDRDHAKELFAAGREVGLSGKWFDAPPSSPSLLPQQTYDLSSETTTAKPVGPARPSCRLRSTVTAEDSSPAAQSA